MEVIFPYEKEIDIKTFRKKGTIRKGYTFCIFQAVIVAFQGYHTVNISRCYQYVGAYLNQNPARGKI